MKNAFYLILNAFFVLEMFTFLSWLFAYVETRLDKEAMVNFKIYNVTCWTANKANHAIKFGQLIKYCVRNIFLQKSCSKWGRETSSILLFVFLKKFYIRYKQVVSTLVLICFIRPRFGQTIKTNFISLHTVYPEICSILIFYKGSGTSFSKTFCVSFFKKIFILSILLTD